MSNNHCARCGLPSSQQGHYFPSCNSPTWWEGRTGKPWDKANMRDFHQCCPQPYGCALDETPKALLLPERKLLRAVVLAAADNGLALRRDRDVYDAEFGVTRWRTVRQGVAVITVEHWKRHPDRDAETWKFRVTANSMQVEIRDGLTLNRAVDALVVTGMLPETLSTLHALGVSDAANAIETYADSIGWYESSGVWAEAIERAQAAAGAGGSR